MKKRFYNGLLGARVAKPLFSVLVLAGLATPVWSVQVTESSPSYVAPSERAQRVVPPVMETQQQLAEATPAPEQTAAPVSSSGYSQVSNDSITAADDSGGDVEEFGIITDSVEPANPLADDRKLLVQELQTLRAKVETQERQIRELKEKSKALYADLDRRLQKMAEKLVALETAPKAVVTPVEDEVAPDPTESVVAEGSTSSETDQSRYQKAKAILDEGGRDTKAALEFVRLLKDYPDTPLKPNVYYWLAQIYKRSGEVEKAEGFYNRVLEEYPKSIKAASSLYSLASMKSSQGLKAEADQLLKRLLDVYPNSAEAVKAKASLAAPK
ncbi:tetratricopeptide repeat protein [Litoribrevibacter albus]|uniref:YbgF trimerisation domain-containing protein n=1 Tax=Litoribrevibacter albus TaxID=1473156 RepID=A0AA37W650_9GAMM|nr:tetratricopeptide repeat protein [Litoribrevibacter albus]GLQ31240.1 hypothetical protein GCM10007876_17190 [Litoribrevibacter albus]